MRGRWLLTALLVVGLVLPAACSSQPDAPGAGEAPVPVPSASPAGAAYGRLLDSEDRSVPGGTVTLTQPFDDNVVLLSVRLVSLGVFCLIRDAGLCPTSHRADLAANGLWSVSSGDVEPGKALTFAGRRPGEGSALTAVSVPNGADPQRVPDIELWEPRIELAATARGTRVSWPGLGDAPHGKSIRYAVYVSTGDPAFARPVEVARGLRRTTAMVPGWMTEDQAMRVSVVASTRRGRAAFVYTAPTAATDGAATPISRGRPCTTDRGGRQVRAIGRCGLTDGDLVAHQQVRLKGECDVDVSGCRPDTHRRICVDLGRLRPVARVVVRTPFLAVDQVVELSRDGRSFAPVSRLGDVGADDARVFDVPVRPSRQARFVCIRSDDYGYAGATTAEISAW